MIDYDRLKYLNNKVKSSSASISEKDEYMMLLYTNKSITKSQYHKYLKDKNSGSLINTAITIGGIILLGYIIDKITSNS